MAEDKLEPAEPAAGGEAAEAKAAEVKTPTVPVREEAAFHKPAAQERRTQARYLAHWRAALVNPADGNVRYLGKTDNISLSGAAIISDANVPAKQDYHVYLEIPQPNGKSPLILELIGRVVYSNLANNSFRVGVSFKQYHGDAENVLQAIIKSGKLKQIFDPDSV